MTARSADDMLESVGAGQTLLADRAYDSDALRETLAARGAKANVKPMPNRVNIPKFNKRLYKKRNLVERFFNKLKHFRAVATRFEKHDANFLALNIISFFAPHSADTSSNKVREDLNGTWVMLSPDNQIIGSYNTREDCTNRNRRRTARLDENVGG